MMEKLKNTVAPDKRGIHIKFFLFLLRNLGTPPKHLGEALLMSTYNMFCGEIKISTFQLKIVPYLEM